MSTDPLATDNPAVPRRHIPISTWVIAIVGLAIVVAAGFFVAGVSGYGPLDFNRDKRIDDYCSRAIAKANFLWTLMLGDESKTSLSTEELLKGLQNHNLLIKRCIQETEKDRTPPGCRGVREAMLNYLHRLERFTREDVVTSRELYAQNKRAEASSLLVTATKEIQSALNRVFEATSTARPRSQDTD